MGSGNWASGPGALWGALGALLTALGALLGCFEVALAPLLARFGCSVRFWVLQLARFGCPVRSWAPWLNRFGCKRMPQRLPHRHDKQKKIDLLIDDPASMLPASCTLERFFMPQI